MNYIYPQLTKIVLPNAIVVVNKFHIINALDRVFIKNRIRLMKQFASSPREFRGLKRYWKSLLVPSEQLDFEHFHKWTNFPYWIAATDVVHNLLSLDSELKQIYEVLNHVRTAIQHKGWNNYNTACWKAEGFSEEMNSTIEML